MDSFDICIVVRYVSKVLHSTTPTPFSDFEVKVMVFEISGLLKYSNNLLVHSTLDGFNLYLN